VSGKRILFRIDEKMKICLAAENLMVEDSPSSLQHPGSKTAFENLKWVLYHCTNIVTPFRPHLGLEMVQKGHERCQSLVDQLRSGIFPKRKGRLR
jgi:hypothetical protein